MSLDEVGALSSEEVEEWMVYSRLKYEAKKQAYDDAASSTKGTRIAADPDASFG